MNEKEQQIMVEAFKDELLFCLFLKSKKELTEDNISQLEFDTDRLEKQWEELDENEDFYSLSKYIGMSKELIQLIKKEADNEELVRKNFYVTRSQLRFLDEYAKEQGFGGKTVRSLAFRDIVSKAMKEY